MWITLAVGFFFGFVSGALMVCLIASSEPTSLDDEEQALKEYRFIRIHKSFLVNCSYIRDVSRLGAELKINKRLNIAQPRYNDVKREFLLFRGKCDG